MMELSCVVWQGIMGWGSHKKCPRTLGGGLVGYRALPPDVLASQGALFLSLLRDLEGSI